MPLGFDALVALSQLKDAVLAKIDQRSAEWKKSTTIPEIAPEGMPSPLDMYGGPGLGAGRVGILTGREKLASNVIKRGLKEPWFHGTKTPERKLPELAESKIKLNRDALKSIYEKIADLEGIKNSFPPQSDGWRSANFRIGELRSQAYDISQSIPKYLKFTSPENRPFNLDRLGEGMAIKLGEPAGISVSKSPSVVKHFGQPLRVGIDVHPSQVGDLLDPEVLKMYRNAYEKVINQQAPGDFGKATRTFANIPHDELISDRSHIRRLSADLSAELRRGGLEAVQYNPNRYNELELRVFDPEKVIPLGKARAPYGDSSEFTQRESDAFQRWYDRAVRTKFQDWKDAGQGKPARISEMLEGLPHMKSDRYNYKPFSSPALPLASEYVTDDFAIHHLAQLPEEHVYSYLNHPDTLLTYPKENIIKAIQQHKMSPEFADYIKKDPLSPASKEHFYNFSELGNKTKEPLESIYGSPVSETLKDKLMQLGMENVMEPVPPKGWENADAFFKSKGF